MSEEGECLGKRQKIMSLSEKVNMLDRVTTGTGESAMGNIFVLMSPPSGI